MRRRAVLAVATMLVFLGGCDRDGDGEVTHRGDGDGLFSDETGEVRKHDVARARDGLQEASLVVVNGATTVSVRSADLGDTLYRITTPADSQIAPSVAELSDRFQVHFNGTGQPGPSVAEVLLNKDVRWNVRLGGGASESLVDFSTGRLTGLEFSAGSSRIEVKLPRPTGTTVVRMSGGASDFIVRAPSGVPVLARMTGGAGSVTIDGQRRSGIAGNTELTPSDWDGATDRYEIDAVAGVSSLTVDRY
jgi:hypothetical protein